MAYEIVNSLRSKSTIRVTGNTDTLITLSQLSPNTSLETVTAAAITHIKTSSNGVWTIYRGDNNSGTKLLELNLNDTINLEDLGIGALSNSSTSNIFVTNTGTVGTLLLVVAKTATYSTDTGIL